MRNNPYSTQVRYNVYDPANPYAPVSNYHAGLAAPAPHQAASAPGVHPCQSGGACQCGGKCGGKAASAGGCSCGSKNPNGGATAAGGCGAKANAAASSAVAPASPAAGVPASDADRRSAAFAAMANSPALQNAMDNALNSSYFKDSAQGRRAAMAVKSASSASVGAGVSVKEQRAAAFAAIENSPTLAQAYANALNSSFFTDTKMGQRAARAVMDARHRQPTGLVRPVPHTATFGAMTNAQAALHGFAPILPINSHRILGQAQRLGTSGNTPLAPQPLVFPWQNTELPTPLSNASPFGTDPFPPYLPRGPSLPVLPYAFIPEFLKMWLFLVGHPCLLKCANVQCGAVGDCDCGKCPPPQECVNGKCECPKFACSGDCGGKCPLEPTPIGVLTAAQIVALQANACAGSGATRRCKCTTSNQDECTVLAAEGGCKCPFGTTCQGICVTRLFLKGVQQGVDFETPCTAAQYYEYATKTTQLYANMEPKGAYDFQVGMKDKSCVKDPFDKCPQCV